MRVFEDTQALLAWSRAERGAGRSVGFVPTLGCLHAGHATLLRRARGDNANVVLSVFVNPFQFRRDKYESYPRALDADLELARREGVAAVLAPSVEAMYPGAPSLDALFGLHADDGAAVRRDDEFVAQEPFGAGRFVHLRVPRGLVERMDGRLFPWHFDAVATVVARLFEVVEPDVAYFGEKDPQQLAILRRLAAWLPRTVEIRQVPVVRDADGMPASSRNTLLCAAQRATAAHAPAALARGEELLRGGLTDTEALCSEMRALVAREPGIRLDYLGAVDPLTLAAPAVLEGEALLYVSYFVDGIRLTDSRLVELAPAPRT